MTWATEQTPAALRYVGGKHRIAEKIAALLPPHRVYVEPFGGGANVLLAKKPAQIEVYNDLDGDVVNFFRVLRDPELAPRLLQMLALTPWSREEFERAYEPTDDPVESARRLAIRNQMSVGCQATHYKSDGFQWASRYHRSLAARWDKYPDRLIPVMARLKTVIIERRPAEEVIRRHDATDACFYVDPPYIGDTRSTNIDRYKHEMRDPKEHAALLAQLAGCAGAVVLSGYDSEEYAELLEGWERQEFVTAAMTNANERERIEVVWIKLSNDPPEELPTTDLAALCGGPD